MYVKPNSTRRERADATRAGEMELFFSGNQFISRCEMERVPNLGISLTSSFVMPFGRGKVTVEGRT